MKNVYFVGTAGSGKSTLVGAFGEWLGTIGVEAVTVNLDPGVDATPYVPDVDIRTWVSLDDVMDAYGLGPNGAQIVAADLMAVNIGKLKDELSNHGSRYALIDTPGQLELFAFRQSSSLTIDSLGRGDSFLTYLTDPLLCGTANGFVSGMMLSTLVQFRLGIPTHTVVTKSDLIDEDDAERLTRWFGDPDPLYFDMLEETSDPQSVVGTELLKALESVGVFGGIGTVSARDGTGLEDLHAVLERSLFGGEDPAPE
ncbi:MAG: GTPase [Thermoplasmatales archaeon]|nr:GTPase [Thermoplasmatales archaeon]